MYPLFPENLTKINDRISVLSIENMIYYYKDDAVIYAHELNNTKNFRFAVCQLIISYLAEQSEIEKIFRINKSSIVNWIMNHGDEGDESFYEIRKKHIYLWSAIKSNPQRSSREVIRSLAEKGIVVSITIKQVNRLRVLWGLNRAKGRPRGLQTRLINKQQTETQRLKMTNIIGRKSSTKQDMRKIYL